MPGNFLQSFSWFHYEEHDWVYLLYGVFLCVLTSHRSSAPSWRPWLHSPTGTCRRLFGNGKTASGLWTPGARHTLKTHTHMHGGLSFKGSSPAGTANVKDRNGISMTKSQRRKRWLLSAWGEPEKHCRYTKTDADGCIHLDVSVS